MTINIIFAYDQIDSDGLTDFCFITVTWVIHFTAVKEKIHFKYFEGEYSGSNNALLKISEVADRRSNVGQWKTICFLSSTVVLLSKCNVFVCFLHSLWK